MNPPSTAGTPVVRDATAADAEACAAIYAPYVRDTTITFEVEPPDAAEFARRIDVSQQTYAWLVLVDVDHRDPTSGERVLGYAYATRYKERAAYDWSCEVSVYLDRDQRGRGGGRRLYTALFDRLAARGFRMAIAGMTLPNEASVGLHAALGFEPIGVYRRIGWKHGAWRDVAWAQRPLGGDEPPVALR